MILTEDQKKFVESPQKYIALKALPGTGKTKTLTERVIYFNKLGLKKTIICSYSIRSTKEFVKRVLDHQSLNKSGKIIGGTLDSLIHQSLKYQGLQIGARQFSQKRKKFLELLTQSKKNFLPVPFNEAEHLAVDEFQDLDELQTDIVLILGRRIRRLSIAGDPRQSFHQQNNFTNFEANYPEGFIQKLDINFRSSREIIEFVNAGFGINMKSIRPRSGIKTEWFYHPPLTRTVTNLMTYITCKLKVWLFTNKYDFGDILIQCRRSNSSNMYGGHKIYGPLSQFITNEWGINKFVWVDENLENRLSVEMDNKIVLCSSKFFKGQERKCVFVIGATSGSFPCLFEKNNNEVARNELLVACTRAREQLCITSTINRATPLLNKIAESYLFFPNRACLCELVQKGKYSNYSKSKRKTLSELTISLADSDNYQYISELFRDNKKSLGLVNKTKCMDTIYLHSLDFITRSGYGIYERTLAMLMFKKKMKIPIDCPGFEIYSRIYNFDKKWISIYSRFLKQDKFSRDDDLLLPWQFSKLWHFAPIRSYILDIPDVPLTGFSGI